MRFSCNGSSHNARHAGGRRGAAPGFGAIGGYGDGGFGGGWGGRGGGGRRRLFDSGELRLLLLALIAEQPRHGYDLIRAIEERTGGDYAPSPGVVYPTITMLQDMALIDEEKGEGARRVFSATEEGRRHLAEHEAEVEALFQRLGRLAAMREKMEGGPVRRAIHNLRSVLHHRLSRDDVDRETLHQVAAMLDEVAQKIERL